MFGFWIGDGTGVTEQVENHLFRHRQDHFQKYDYAFGFLFGLTTAPFQH